MITNIMYLICAIMGIVALSVCIKKINEQEDMIEKKNCDNYKMYQDLVELQSKHAMLETAHKETEKENAFMKEMLKKLDDEIARLKAENDEHNYNNALLHQKFDEFFEQEIEENTIKSVDSRDAINSVCIELTRNPSPETQNPITDGGNIA